MSNCLCEFVFTVWLHLLKRTRSPESSLDSVLDTLTSRQIQIELQDRRCVSEAKRHHACGSKALFRAKMLEHRRLQAQLLQLQRYRENVHAQLDALSHHEINQTFVRAMAQRPTFNRDEAITTMDDLQESINSAKEMTELLGQPIDAGMDVLDEDLELEFMETVETTPLIVPPSPVQSVRAEPAPIQQLALPAAMMMA